MAHPTQITRVTGSRAVAPEVRELTLASPPEPLEFAPGQWISLHLPVGERPPLVRAYSLAAPMSPSGQLVLCLDRVPYGLGSDYLFGLKPGDEVTFAGPLGNFVLPGDGGDLLWLARYTGIVPFRAMLLHLEQHPPAGRVHLVYSGQAPEDLAYHAELLRAAEEHSWLGLTTLVDEPHRDWTGRSGQTLELVPELLAGGARLTPMICGKREFVRPLRDFFYERGYEKRAVKWENYD